MPRSQRRANGELQARGDPGDARRRAAVHLCIDGLRRSTELLTAIAALEAIDDGVFALDTPVTALLPAGVFTIEPSGWAERIPPPTSPRRTRWLNAATANLGAGVP